MSRASRYIKSLWNAVIARYDAAYQTQDRAYVFSPVSDARADISSFSRIELLRKGRYHEQNSPIVQKTLDVRETNVIGTGIKPTPTSSAPKWNKASLKYFLSWAKKADMSGLLSFFACQAIADRAKVIDGDHFWWKRYDPDTKRPRLHLIEGHRVTGDKSSIRGLKGMEGMDVVDGVVIDTFGRPRFYLVATDDFDSGVNYHGNLAVVPAEQIIPIFEASRVGQYRNVSEMHSILNTLQDIEEIINFEMKAVKDASSTSKVLQTKSGTADKRDVFAQTTQDLNQKLAYYKKTLGAETVVLNLDDKYTQFMSNRPTVTVQAFWEFVEEKICNGLGVSFSAYKDYKTGINGPALRAVIVSDSANFKIRSASLSPAFDQVWEYVIADAIANNLIVDENGVPIKAPANWKDVNWHPPRRVTIDVGRDSKALIDEVRSGFRTLQIVAAEQGLDWRDVLEQRAEELSYQRQLEEQNKLPPGSLSSFVDVVNERADVAQLPTDDANPPKTPPAASEPGEPQEQSQGGPQNER